MSSALSTRVLLDWPCFPPKLRTCHQRSVTDYGSRLSYPTYTVLCPDFNKSHCRLRRTFCARFDSHLHFNDSALFIIILTVQKEDVQIYALRDQYVATHIIYNWAEDPVVRASVGIEFVPWVVRSATMAHAYTLLYGLPRSHLLFVCLNGQRKPFDPRCDLGCPKLIYGTCEVRPIDNNN